MSHCIQIVNELNALGYCSSRLFPGYAGVNMQMQDEMMFRQIQDEIEKINKV